MLRKPKAINFISLLQLICLFASWVTSRFSNKEDAIDIPYILWWDKDFFPHVEAEGNKSKLITLNCPNLDHVCHVTQDRNLLDYATVLTTIVIYGTNFNADEAPLPRLKNHMWALIHEESPQNNFMLCHEQALNLFNFSSTFKGTSDFPLITQHFPSIDHLIGRKPLSIREKNHYRSRGLAPVVYLQSNCEVSSDRDRYVQELMRHIAVDSYGACLNNKRFDDDSLRNPTAHMGSDKLHDLLSRYKFHIAFENAICPDYVTEKLTRAFHVGSVPVYRGSNTARHLSPSHDAILMADDFASPKDLASYLKYLDENDTAYGKLLAYKHRPVLPNHALAHALANRTWSPDGYDVGHFVGAFECYICEQMHAIANHRKYGTDHVTTSRVVAHDHLSCPPPSPSFGTINLVPRHDRLHNWIDDYWGGMDLARGLHDMVSNGETDPTQVWSYIERRYDRGEGAFPHTPATAHDEL